jgi:alpha-ribazole phosphatase
MRVVLIRHGETPGNRERRYVGRTDEPLSETGRRQARSLRAPEADRVYCSPYLRCLQTARLLFPGRELLVHEDLRECDFGIFEGKTAAELEDCPEYRAWVEGGCVGAIPGGEDIPSFQRRCCAAFEAIVRAEAESGKTLVFVVHGGVIMAVLDRFHPEKRDFFTYAVGNCGVLSCECEIGDGISLFLPEDAVC